jgi:transposase InsO family protein
MAPSDKPLPFTFCAVLGCLLTSNANGDCCNANETFLPTASSIVLKRRAAKLRELKRRLTPKESAFELVGRKRTAKHKQHHRVLNKQANVVGARSKRWLTDSGANVSVTNDLTLFVSIQNYNPDVPIRVANNQIVRPSMVGTVQLNLHDKRGDPYTLLLRNVFYSPDFSTNLLSVDELYKQHRISTVFKGDCHLRTTDGCVIPIPRSDGGQFMLTAYGIATEVDPEIWHRRLMHVGNEAMRNMGHCIPSLAKKHFDFSKCDACLQGGGKKQPFGRSKRRARDNSFKKHTRFVRFGQRISSDLCGPFPVGTHGERYAIVFHDSFTKYIAVYTITDKTKEQVLGAFQRFLADHHSELPNGVDVLWTDGGGEYVNKDMERFCEEICTHRRYTVPYSSPQNPYAERTWGDLLRKVRTALVASGAHEAQWTYAIKQAALVHNILCNDNGESPFSKVFGECFDYDSLHAWGCLCYYLVPERYRDSKLSPTALPARYLGKDPDRNGHLLYVPGLSRYVSAYHVVFNEYRYLAEKTYRGKVCFDDDSEARDNDIREDDFNSGQFHQEDQDITTTRNTTRLRDDINEDNYHPANDTSHGTVSTHTEQGHWSKNHCENSRCTYPKGHKGLCSHQEVDKPRSRTQVPRLHRLYSECAEQKCVYRAGHFGSCEDAGCNEIIKGPEQCCECQEYEHPDYQIWKQNADPLFMATDDLNRCVYAAKLDEADDITPNSYDEAIRSILKDAWKESMRTEFDALIRNKTWEYISRSDKRLRGRKPTKSRWVYKVKYNRDGTVERFKSRFCVCGYSQREGIDYDRAFSATLRASSFRTLLAVSAGRKLKLVHFDVTNAFVQADLDDVDLFVEPPKGFEEYEIVNGEKVSKLLHLQKALYGSKQASRLWQETLRRFLSDYKCKNGQHFTQSFADPCIFRLQSGNDEIILGVYVDDIVVAYKGEETFKQFSNAFTSRFESRFEGPLHWFLGMGIDQADDFTITLSHEASIVKMVDKYIPHNTVSRECPSADLFNKLDRAQNDLERVQVQGFAYASMVGALMYIAVMSRPDICFHTSILAKFLSDPSQDCCKAATQLMQYVHSTRKQKMSFSGKIEVPIGLEKYRADVERNHGFVAYSDSSWGNKYPYPMFGHGIYLYGGLISFASKQLKTVAFSSCEAEYAAASYCCKEVEFIRNLCADLGLVLQGRLVLALDNTACIDIAHDVGVSGRTKHFDRAIHYLRDLTQLRRILPVYVSTSQQRGDGYTKGLDKSTFHKWLSTLCVA